MIKQMIKSFFTKEEKSEDVLFEIAFKKLSYFRQYMHLQHTRLGYFMALSDYEECENELFHVKVLNNGEKRDRLTKLINRLNLMNQRGFC